MDAQESETLNTVKAAFGMVESLVADARGNALVMPDRTRIHFGAEYLRLAAQQSAALADLLDAAAKTNQKAGDRAKKRLREIKHDIEKHLDVVAQDGPRMMQAHGGKQVALSGADARELFEAAKQNGGTVPADILERLGVDLTAGPELATDEDAEKGSSATGDEAAAKSAKPTADIPLEIMLPVEAFAYQTWCEMADLAYKKDGMRAVIQSAVAAIAEVEKISTVVEQEVPVDDQERRHRTLLFQALTMERMPKLREVLEHMPDGEFYWEDYEGNPVDFPEPGQRLRTAAESRAVMEKGVKAFETYQAVGGRVLPGFFNDVLTP